MRIPQHKSNVNCFLSSCYKTCSDVLNALKFFQLELRKTVEDVVEARNNKSVNYTLKIIL